MKLEPPEFEMGHVVLTMPVSGWSLICMLGFAMINLQTMNTNFEVSIVTHYKDMKGNAECRKWGWFGMVRGHLSSPAVTIR